MLQDLNSRAEKEYVSPYFIGLIHLGLVENEQAITWMQQACRKKDFVATMFYLKADPNFDSIRNDPAFQDLLQCMKLS